MKTTFSIIAFVAAALLLCALGAKLAAHTDESPVNDLAFPASVSASTVDPPPPPPETVAVDVGDVKRADSLHQCAVERVLALRRAYPDRGEDIDMRTARLTYFANDVADAVANDKRIADEDRENFMGTLLLLAHRETLLARDPAKMGNQDLGEAIGPWQIHARGYHVDPYTAKGALAVYFDDPKSWALPRPKPWLGLVGNREVGWTSATDFMRAHPCSGTSAH